MVRLRTSILMDPGMTIEKFSNLGIFLIRSLHFCAEKGEPSDLAYLA